MYYVAFARMSPSGNEAVVMCFSFVCVCVCFSKPCVKPEMLRYAENAMKVALPTVKRIQCRVAVQIQLAFWLP